MKRIEALVRPAALENIKEGLASAEVRGLTVSEARVFGCIQRRGVYRGSAHTLDFAPALKIEIVAFEALCQGSSKRWQIPRLAALAQSSCPVWSTRFGSEPTNTVRTHSDGQGLTSQKARVFSERLAKHRNLQRDG